MKKAIFLFVFAVLSCSLCFSQANVKPVKLAKAVNKGPKTPKWNYKVGLVMPMPVEISLQSRPSLKSVMVEASHKLSNKIDMTFNAGYLFFDYRYSDYFDNRIAGGGLRYNTNNGGTYFGVTAAAGFFSEDFDFVHLLWSPYVGIKGKRLSGDLRYFNWRNLDNSLNTLGIVISYNL